MKARKALKHPRGFDIAPRVDGPAYDVIEDHFEEAIEDATGQVLDFDALEAEFEEQGALSEESYAMLETAGLPRTIVDRHIEGRLAANDLLRQEILAMVGGAERYWRMSEWARQQLTPEAFERFQASLIGDPADVKAVIEDLSEIYADATGDAAEDAPRKAPSAKMKRPERIGAPVARPWRKASASGRRAERPAPSKFPRERRRASKSPAMRRDAALDAAPVAQPRGDQPSQTGGQRFASAEQLAKAIRDPRYRTDPAYRAWVADTVAKSDVFDRKGARSQRG